MNTIKQNGLVSGALWSFFGQFGYMFIGLLGNIFLARLLSPAEFGQIGIVMFFVILANVLVESGFSGALIRLKEVKDEDYSTIFIFNLVVSVILFVVLFLFSGIIADFYSDPSLKKILMALSSILIINSFQITQNAKLVRNMEFKKRSIYKFISLFCATIFSVILAYNGYGVWAIVALQVLTSLFLTMLYFFFEKRLGKLSFSRKSFKSMYSFGVNTTIASVLNTAFDNIYQLILGRYFSINQVGFFYQAKRLQEVSDSLFKIVTLNVVYSHLSKIQDNKEQFKSSYAKIAIISASIVGFTTSIVVLYAKQIIMIIYGQKWIESAFFLQLLAISSFFFLQEIVNRNIFKVYNQTRKILYLEIIKKTIQSITIIIGIYYMSLTYLIYGYVLTSICSYCINYYYSRKIIDNISFKEIKSLLLIVLVSSFGVSMLFYMQVYLNIKGYYAFFLTPLFLIFYFLVLKMVKVFNVFEELKLIIKSKNK